jgi:predicted phage tail protein
VENKKFKERKMQTVILKGELGNRFGEKWNVNCDNLLGIFKLIECQREGFRPYMLECQENEIEFSVQRGNTYVEDESELLMSVGEHDITITPLPRGSKGVGKLVAAVFLIAAGYWIVHAAGTAAAMGSGFSGFTLGATKAIGYSLMVMGTSMGLRTINEMLMPTSDQDDEDDSHLFGGPTNNTAEGTPIPIAYGELMVGGVVINGSYTATKGKSYGSGSTNTTDGVMSTRGGGDTDAIQLQ